MEEAVGCLRDKPAASLSALQWNGYKSILAFPSAPTIDGKFLPRHPIDMLKDGDFKKTELLIGSNKNEGKVLGIS
jgi:acetylcholinesterase